MCSLGKPISFKERTTYKRKASVPIPENSPVSKLTIPGIPSRCFAAGRLPNYYYPSGALPPAGFLDEYPICAGRDPNYECD